MGFLEKSARLETETEKRQKFVKDLQKCVLSFVVQHLIFSLFLMKLFVKISELVLKFRPQKYVGEGRLSPAFAQTFAALFAKGLIRDIALYLRISDCRAEESREGKSHNRVGIQNDGCLKL